MTLSQNCRTFLARFGFVASLRRGPGEKRSLLALLLDDVPPRALKEVCATYGINPPRTGKKAAAALSLMFFPDDENGDAGHV